MNIEIANRLVELRKQNNLSQEALAEKLGISRQAVSKWERADASPDMDNLITLSKLYQISLDELLGTGNGANSVSCPVAESRAEVMEADPVVIIEEEKVKFNFASLRHFPVYMVVAIAFIILGAVWNLWHPAWLLFFDSTHLANHHAGFGKEGCQKICVSCACDVYLSMLRIFRQFLASGMGCLPDDSHVLSNSKLCAEIV